MALSKKIILVLVGFSLSFSFLFSQKSNIGNWYIYFGNQKINQHFNWHNEVQYRNYNAGGDLEQLLLRTGIGYNLNPNNNLLIGYAFIHSENYVIGLTEKTSINEHRIFQQYIAKHKLSRFYIQHRLRFEERFFTTDTKFRGRYFLGLNIPFTKKTMEKNALYLSAYNEIFLNTQTPNFDRNRLYGALGFVLAKNLKFELGMMTQFLQTKNRTQFQIVLFNTIPFRE